jgi:hypothetical protein
MAHENIDKTLKSGEAILSQFDLARKVHQLAWTHHQFSNILPRCRGEFIFVGRRFMDPEGIEMCPISAHLK